MTEKNREYGLATAEVTNQLRQEVLAGTFAAGHRVRISDVAARFKVSAMPVREALRTLEAEGLLQMEPNKGAIVRPVDEEFVRNIYDVRGALEALMVERACLNMNFEARRALEAIQESIDDAAAAENSQELLRLNSDFHRKINSLGANPEAERLQELNQNIILALRRQVGFRPGRLQSIAQEHHLILKAMFSRDLAETVALCRMHVVSARDDLIASIRAKKA